MMHANAWQSKPTYIIKRSRTQSTYRVACVLLFVSGMSVPMNIQSFPRIRKEGRIYVDKSLFISELMSHSGTAFAILRPRRFGKSLLLSMTESFLSHAGEPELFNGLAICKDTEFCKTHMGRYTVIKISFMGIGGPDIPTIHDDILHALDDMLRPHWNLVSTSISRYFNGTLLSTESPTAFLNSLEDSSKLGEMSRSRLRLVPLRLIESIRSVQPQTKIVLLVDEYDGALNEQELPVKFKADVDEFLTKMYTLVLRESDCLSKACLMGVSDIRNPSTVSGLNSLTFLSISEQCFSNHFGFTQDEVKNELAKHCGVDNATCAINYAMAEGICDWYNGYHFGNHPMVNPCSFMKYIANDRLFRPYWITMTSIVALYNQFRANPPLVAAMSDILMELLTPVDLDGRKVYKAIDMPGHLDMLVYGENRAWTLDNTLSYLCVSGFLAYRRKQQNVGERPCTRQPSRTGRFSRSGVASSATCLTMWPRSRITVSSDGF